MLNDHPSPWSTPEKSTPTELEGAAALLNAAQIP
jgi:hypothetical protein